MRLPERGIENHVTRAGGDGLKAGGASDLAVRPRPGEIAAGSRS